MAVFSAKGPENIKVRFFYILSAVRAGQDAATARFNHFNAYCNFVLEKTHKQSVQTMTYG